MHSNHLPDDQQVTPEDYARLVEEANQLLARIRTVEVKQGVWNEELKRCFVVEEQQRIRTEELTEMIQDEEVNAMTNPEFAAWMGAHDRYKIEDEGGHEISTWFHVEKLATRTPFAAIVPCPRQLTEEGASMLEASIDEFGFNRFFIQTVYINANLSDISRAFVRSPSHLPLHLRGSKSERGPLEYVATPCHNGMDASMLIRTSGLLRLALNSTPCLFLNDYAPRMPLCLRAQVVAGTCVAAEAACDCAYAPFFGIAVNDDGEGDGGERASRPSLPDNTPCDVLACALQSFVETTMRDSLGKRSYSLLLLAEIKGFDPRVLRDRDPRAPFRESLGGNTLDQGASPFSEDGIRFFLANVDAVDAVTFECFTEEELRVVGGYIQRRARMQNFYLPPVLRFLDANTSMAMEARKGINPKDSVATNIRQSERAAQRNNGQSYASELSDGPRLIAETSYHAPPSDRPEVSSRHVDPMGGALSGEGASRPPVYPYQRCPTDRASRSSRLPERCSIDHSRGGAMPSNTEDVNDAQRSYGGPSDRYPAPQRQESGSERRYAADTAAEQGQPPSGQALVARDEDPSLWSTHGGAQPVAGVTAEDLERARMLAISAVVTANAAMEAALRGGHNPSPPSDI